MNQNNNFIVNLIHHYELNKINIFLSSMFSPFYLENTFFKAVPLKFEITIAMLQ